MCLCTICCSKGISYVYSTANKHYVPIPNNVVFETEQVATYNYETIWSKGGTTMAVSGVPVVPVSIYSPVYVLYYTSFPASSC